MRTSTPGENCGVIGTYDGTWSDLQRRSHVVLGDIGESMYFREYNIFYHVVLYFVSSATLKNAVLKPRVDFSSANITDKHRDEPRESEGVLFFQCQNRSLRKGAKIETLRVFQNRVEGTIQK